MVFRCGRANPVKHIDSSLSGILFPHLFYSHHTACVLPAQWGACCQERRQAGTWAGLVMQRMGTVLFAGRQRQGQLFPPASEPAFDDSPLSAEPQLLFPAGLPFALVHPVLRQDAAGEERGIRIVGGAMARNRPGMARGIAVSRGGRCHTCRCQRWPRTRTLPAGFCPSPA